MVQQRTEVNESLLVRQGDGNVAYSEENGAFGVGDNVTAILALSTFTVACIAFGVGCAVGYSSPTQSSIMQDLGLSVAEVYKSFQFYNQFFVSAVFTFWFNTEYWGNPRCCNMREDNRFARSEIGMLCPASLNIDMLKSYKLFNSMSLDQTMWILNLFYISGWLVIAFAKVPWLLDLGRLSLGFTNGISGYLAPIYIAEITTKNVRGRFAVIVPLMVCWGISFMYIVGSFVNWRTLALIATSPGLLQLLLLFFIPESPRWLAKVGRHKELEAALLCLRGDKADISDEATKIKDFVESLKSFSKEGNLDIFQKKYIRPLLIVVGMLALMNLGGLNAFAYYSGVIFVSSGVSSMVGLIALAAVQTVTGILGTIVIDKLGRRPLLLVSSAGLCFSSFLVGLSFFLKDTMINEQEFHWWDQGSHVFALIGLPMHMGMNVLGAGIPWLLLSELFPINVKGSAGSLCNVIGSIFGWFVAYYFNYLIKWNSAGTFFMFSAFCCANFVLTVAMVPETKGRTLEEIQASITHSSD
ncbi:Sugar transporter ERD6 14 isoform 3 [Hibiscus syriacus]|uniref:Sugar transporter ERD6 14 isoform 3 n=1 Tax=Hibiscus syriacus TaxID=106335 RepID=A0A6A2YIG5_HIBSY|nr:Sugar transporter ERD6 14 isoform 3 [Hibiscus syriacus]